MQVGLHLCCLQTPKTGFLTSRPIWILFSGVIYKEDLLFIKSAPVLLNSLNKLGKRDKMVGFSCILLLFCNKFIQFDNTGT